MSFDCPEFTGSKDSKKRRVLVKKENISEVVVAESDSDCSYFRVQCRKVAPIIVRTKVQDKPIECPVDSDASVSLISSETVREQQLWTQSAKPLLLCQAVYPKPTVVNK
jgi:N-glycosylase/DNA lyase